MIFTLLEKKTLFLLVVWEAEIFSYLLPTISYALIIPNYDGQRDLGQIPLRCLMFIRHGRTTTSMPLTKGVGLKRNGLNALVNNNQRALKVIIILLL